MTEGQERQGRGSRPGNGEYNPAGLFVWRGQSACPLCNYFQALAGEGVCRPCFRRYIAPESWENVRNAYLERERQRAAGALRG